MKKEEKKEGGDSISYDALISRLGPATAVTGPTIPAQQGGATTAPSKLISSSAIETKFETVNPMLKAATAQSHVDDVKSETKSEPPGAEKRIGPIASSESPRPIQIRHDEITVDEMKIQVSDTFILHSKKLMIMGCPHSK